MRTKFLPLLCLALLTCGGSANADEQVRRVQEELRKRNLYFGDIDGTKGKEISGAIRRYQERKGFTASGELDPDTLRSLNLPAPGSIASAWPEGIILKSDVAREVSESDRKLLESLEAADPPAPVAEAPPLDAPAIEPANAPPEVASMARRAEEFVRSYLAACESNKLDAEMTFYADRVNYFDKGPVGREFIAKDVAGYYKHWPQRKYELIDFKLGKTVGNDFAVQFKIAFRYKNAEHAVAGRTTNLFTVRQTGEQMQFVSLEEQRVRK